MKPSTPGDRLRSLRQQRGLTLRDVHVLSTEIAERLHNSAFKLPPSRLSEVETQDVVPSVFRLYVLAHLYRCPLKKILSLYGIPPR